jgi:TolA-binding protein
MSSRRNEAPRGVASTRRPVRRWLALAVGVVCALGLLAAGCAKFNTYYNAKQAFDEAERLREQAIREGTDVEAASRGQRQKYLRTIDKGKKLLRDYPGHGLTDDTLFLMGKSYQRLASYRESIRRLDQLFVNFPGNDYMEEALFLQAVNYLMLGNASRSQEFLDRLATHYPESRFQSEALRASGDNAYALEDWEEAVASYSQFLEQFPEAEDWDDSALRLAESLWELERYEEAAVVLADVQARSELADRVFRARLLEARCRVRTGQHERVEEIVADLKNEAQIYDLLGDVTLVEAENLMAQGDLDGGMAMLETMPEEQQTRDVKPVRADLLGYGYLEQGDLEKARESFQAAVGGGDLLEDIDGTRLTLETIKDYLAADGQLPDAAPARAANLRLIKANSLLFGFERPRQALSLYAQVAADTAADSTVAPRALYGAMLVHERWLAQPDSAALYRNELQGRYPVSAQAYLAREGDSADLLAFLREREKAAFEIARQDSTYADQLASAGSGDRRGTLRTGLRRRMVYLMRRDNIVYPPPEAAVLALERRRAEATSLLAQSADSTGTVVAPVSTVAPEGLEAATVAESPVPAAIDSTAAAAVDTTVTRSRYDLLPEHLRPAAEDTVASQPDDPAAAAADSTATPGDDQPEAQPEKKEKSRSWDL